MVKHAYNLIFCCCILLCAPMSLVAQFNTPTIDGTINSSEYGNHTNGFNLYNDGTRNWYLTWNDTHLFIATDGNGNPNNDELVIFIDTDPQTPANGGSDANGALGGPLGGFDGNNYGRLPFRTNFVAFVRNFFHQHRTHNGAGGWNDNIDNSPDIFDFSSGAVQEVRIAWSIITGSGRPAAFRIFFYLNGNDPYGGLSRFALDNDFSDKLNLTGRLYFDIENTNNAESTPPFSRFSYINQRNADVVADYGINFYDVTTADNQSMTITSDMTIRNSLRTEGGCQTTVLGDRTITMTGVSGLIFNNGWMDVNPSYGNTLNFIIDGTITLSGTSPVDVFNLTVNTGDTLKVTGTNLRTGNTGTITVNGTIEFSETNFLGPWGGTANFTLNSGATLITANQRGVNGDDPSTFNGSIRANGTVTYNTSANYAFSRNGDQTVGFTARGTLPAISQANRLSLLTQSTTRDIVLESNFTLTATVSQPALEVGANTTLNISSFNVTANGSLLGSGTISGTGTVQVSSTPASIQIGGLTFNVPLSLQDPDGATLIGNATVTNSGSLTLGSTVKLTLQSGTTLSLNNSPLNVANPETEYIITQSSSKLIRTVGASENKLFPVGTSSGVFPLTLTTGTNVVGGNVEVSVESTNPATGRMGDGTFAVQVIYKVGAPSFNFNSDVIGLEFGWLVASEGTNFDRTKSFPARWTGTMWESYRTNALLTRNNVPTIKQVSIGGLTVLQGDWAVFAGDDDSPLPVSLIDFTAKATTRGIELVWRTASEQDNLGFILLRDGEEIESYRNDLRLRGNGTTLAESQYKFLDEAVEVGRTYTYRLRSVDLNGTIHDYDLSAIATAIEKITVYQLFQNYPNPFNPETVIEYQLPEPSIVKLEVFDILGRKVTTLVDRRQEAGAYRVQFEASSFSLSSGVYFYRLTAGAFISTKKMLFVK
ncbi:MAG: T9SS type A sorting domain-containing protein [Chlorobiales bacterium]